MTASPPRILVAADKFKGSLSASEVCAAIARGINAVSPGSATVLPIADGGDGTVDAALAAGFDAVDLTARDAVGVPHNVKAAQSDQRFIIDTAAVCGMATLKTLAPLTASSSGVGDAILAALDSRAMTIVVGLGGSAATDGGAGMLSALGVVFTDASGAPVEPTGAALTRIAAVDWTNLDPRLSHTTVIALCDVDNPLLGATGSAQVFAPQKGASADDVALLAHGLEHLSTIIGQLPPPSLPHPGAAAATPGAGAAGGLGFGMLCLAAQLRPGAEYILDLINFDAALATADAVVTGEGRLDVQTLSGKAPFVVATRARNARRPAIAVVGSRDLWQAHEWFDAVYELVAVNPDCADDPAESEKVLTRFGAEIARTTVPIVGERSTGAVQ